MIIFLWRATAQNKVTESGEWRTNLSESTGSPGSVNFGAKNWEEFGFEGVLRGVTGGKEIWSLDQTHSAFSAAPSQASKRTPRIKSSNEPLRCWGKTSLFYFSTGGRAGSRTPHARLVQRQKCLDPPQQERGVAGWQPGRGCPLSPQFPPPRSA